MKDYIEFLKDKMAISHQTGFEVRPEEISPYLYPHVKDIQYVGLFPAVAGRYSPASVCRKP